jgi:hypothetical protein
MFHRQWLTPVNTVMNFEFCKRDIFNHRGGLVSQGLCSIEFINRNWWVLACILLCMKYIKWMHNGTLCLSDNLHISSLKWQRILVKFAIGGRGLLWKLSDKFNFVLYQFNDMNINFIFLFLKIVYLTKHWYTKNMSHWGLCLIFDTFSVWCI